MISLISLWQLEMCPKEKGAAAIWDPHAEEKPR